jgi:hydroxymethylpyrimidine/phosphomethylpyrimidine kinase
MSQKNNTRYPFALTIAGSDSGGGAGIQADLKSFAAVGAFGLSAITAITAQNSHAVRAVFPTGAGAVLAQLHAVFEDFPVDAVKTGMLFDADTVNAVLTALKGVCVPLVVDPVMIATSGAALLDERAISAYRPLIARATLLTPNLPEAEKLLGCAPIKTKAAMLKAADALLAWGCEGVLLKGGHAPVASNCFDLLLTRGKMIKSRTCTRWFSTRRLAIRGHGTGCTLSAFITAFLARGLSLEIAVERAIKRLRRSLKNAQGIGNMQIHTPDPFYRLYSRDA